MSIFKRGRVYWYHFYFNGQHLQHSTKQGNPRVARQIEAAHRTRLAKGEVGIAERKPAPILKEFEHKFVDAVQVRSAAKPRTVEFYQQQLARLLEFEPLASARLSEIDEHLIETFIQRRSAQVKPATVNRALATLRRVLRLAHEWRIIDRVPRIRLLNGEGQRDFVLNHFDEMKYLEIAPHPLRDLACFILDTGLRVGEALALEWRDIHIEPANGARLGYIRIRDGKSRNSRRALSLTSRARTLLVRRQSITQSTFVFAEGEKPMRATSFDHLNSKIRQKLKLPPAFVLHSLRHSFLTRLGMAGVDAFTIMRLAGHSSITISQRYVHPTPAAMESAVLKLEALNVAELIEDPKPDSLITNASALSVVATPNHEEYSVFFQTAADQRCQVQGRTL